jgi:cytochrome c biogenesis protein CcmG, thiol:disulfide interchange protein DsbE
VSLRLSTQYSVLGTLLALALAACSGAQPAARLGSPAPDFSLPTADGGTVRLADLKGKPVLINFWATWCQPCREEMPAMQDLYEQYRERGLVILAVDMEEDLRPVRRWIDQGGYTFTFLLDGEGEQVKRYNINASPTSYFVGRDGVIRDLKLGALSRGEMQTKVEKLLES